MPRPGPITLRGAAALLAALLALGGCVQPTPYQPSDGLRGYTEQRVEENRYRISYRASSATAMETVEFYLLYRAAELTLASGHDWFRVVEPEVEGAGSETLGLLDAPAPDGPAMRAGKTPKGGGAPAMRGQGRVGSPGVYRARPGGGGAAPSARGPYGGRTAYGGPRGRPAPGYRHYPGKPVRHYKRGYVGYSFYFGVPIYYPYGPYGVWPYWYGWPYYYDYYYYPYAPPPPPAPPVFATIEILMFKGRKPTDAGDAYDARSVKAELGPRIGVSPG